MCRFESGFFFRHELLKKYDYYWRVEPGIKLFCDVNYDPFLFMKNNNKKYGTSNVYMNKGITTFVSDIRSTRFYPLAQRI